jgi:hypothetical protein
MGCWGSVGNAGKAQGLKPWWFLIGSIGPTKEAAENLAIQGELGGNVPPGLKPYGFYWLYAGVETPASLRLEFFRSL